MLDISYLNSLRRLEIEQVPPELPQGCRILEFGSGTGTQARFLGEREFDVVAIDLANSNYSDKRVYPVQDYDGHRIPIDDQSIDVIFSSNVLEHVENFAETSSEFRRVLKPDGFAIRVLPTSAWRFWSFTTGAAESIKAAAELPACLIRPPEDGDRRRGFIQQMRRIGSGFVPRGHGTSPQGLSELWSFSRLAWRRKFKRHGFRVAEDRPVGLFYTGTVLFGRDLPFARRRDLSRVRGSSTRMYLVRPVAAPAELASVL